MKIEHTPYTRTKLPNYSALIPEEELNELVTELRNIRRQAEDLAAQEEAIKDLIKEQMTLRQATSILGPDYKILWTSYQRTSLDTKALRSAEPELAARFTKTTSCKRFTVE